MARPSASPRDLSRQSSDKSFIMAVETIQSRRSSRVGGVGNAVQELVRPVVRPGCRGGLPDCRRSARHPRDTAGDRALRVPPCPAVPGGRPVQSRLPADRRRLSRGGYRVPGRLPGKRRLCARCAVRIDDGASHVQLRQPDAGLRRERRPRGRDHMARHPCVGSDRRALRSHNICPRDSLHPRSRRHRGDRRCGRVLPPRSPGDSAEPAYGHHSAADKPSARGGFPGGCAWRHRRAVRRHRARRQAVTTRPRPRCHRCSPSRGRLPLRMAWFQR